MIGKRLLCVLLPALLLACLPLSLYSQDASDTTYGRLKATLNEALKESQSLEQQLTDLQSDNKRLLQLSNEQAENLQTLHNVQVDLQTLLQQQSSLLSSSNTQATLLETQLSVSQWVNWVGIPVAIGIGFALSFVIR